MKVLKKNNGFTKSKGFTLVELIVVIAIIGILAAVLIPNIIGYIDKAEKSSVEQEAKGIYNVYSSYLNELEAESIPSTTKFHDSIEGEGVDAVLVRGYYFSITNKPLDKEVWQVDNTNQEIVYTSPDTGYKVYMDFFGVIDKEKTGLN